jgi:STE24 endopeptidase
MWLSVFGKGLLSIWAQIWLLVEVVTLLIAIQPQTWWAWAVLIQLLYSVVLTRFGSLPLLLQAQNIAPLSEGEIPRRFQALVERLHAPSCRLECLKINQRTDAANASFIGWGKGRRVILTDTLLQSFSPVEIEVILAHELAHLVHHDIWTRLIMRGLSFLGFFYLLYACLNVLLMSSNADASPSASGLQLVLALLVLMLLFVFALFVMRYRRRQEYQADEFALQTTGQVQAFKNAMTRLTNMNMQVATSTRRARHPATHPDLLKRLKHADEFAARQRTAVAAEQV